MARLASLSRCRPVGSLGSRPLFPDSPFGSIELIAGLRSYVVSYPSPSRRFRVTPAPIPARETRSMMSIMVGDMRSAIWEILRNPQNRVGIVSVAAILILLVVMLALEYLV